jgi:hypothetical protein
VDAIDENLHDEHAQQNVEEHSQLDDQRHAVGAEQRQQGDAVLEHQKSDDLRDREPPAHHGKQADQNERQRDRQSAARGEADHGGQRPGDFIREHGEAPGDQQGHFRVHQRLVLALGCEARFHAAQHPRHGDALDGDDQRGDEEQLGHVPSPGHDQTHEAKRVGLPAKGADVGRHVAAPQHDERTEQHHACAGHCE